MYVLNIRDYEGTQEFKFVFGRFDEAIDFMRSVQANAMEYMNYELIYAIEE